MREGQRESKSPNITRLLSQCNQLPNSTLRHVRNISPYLLNQWLIRASVTCLIQVAKAYSSMFRLTLDTDLYLGKITSNPLWGDVQLPMITGRRGKGTSLEPLFSVRFYQHLAASVALLAKESERNRSAWYSRVTNSVSSKSWCNKTQRPRGYSVLASGASPGRLGGSSCLNSRLLALCLPLLPESRGLLPDDLQAILSQAACQTEGLKDAE